MLKVKRGAKNHYCALLGRGMKRQFIRLPLGEQCQLHGTGIIEVRAFVVTGEAELQVEGWYYICSERGDCFYLGAKDPHAVPRNTSYKDIFRYLEGSLSYLALLPEAVRRERLKAAVQSVVGEDTLAEAVLTYLLRRRGEEEPAGRWKGSPRYSPWYPDDDKERRDCCSSIRTPSYSFPLSLWSHCLTYRHVAALHGVGERNLKLAVKATEEGLAGPCGLYLLGRGSCDDYPWHAEARSDRGAPESLPFGSPEAVSSLVEDDVPSWWS
ncbi:MAG: cupin domain-containing protein [Moorellales bacterium]